MAADYIQIPMAAKSSAMTSGLRLSLAGLGVVVLQDYVS
jgi:hypothetical protein